MKKRGANSTDDAVASGAAQRDASSVDAGDASHVDADDASAAVVSPGGRDGSSVEQPVEAWRDAKRTPSWAFAAAKMMHEWPIGRVLGEAEYDAAVEAASHVPLSGHKNPPTRRKRK